MAKHKTATKTNGRLEVREAIMEFLAKNPGKTHSVDEIKSSVKQNPALIIKELATMAKDRFSKVKFSTESGNRGYHFIGSIDDLNQREMDVTDDPISKQTQAKSIPAEVKPKKMSKKSIMLSIVSMVIKSKGSPKPLDTKTIADNLDLELGDIEELIQELEDKKAISGQYFEMFDQYILVPTESSSALLDELTSQLEEGQAEEEQLHLFSGNTNNDATLSDDDENDEEFNSQYLNEVAKKRILSTISKSEKDSIIQNAVDYAVLNKLKDQGPHSITNLGSSLEGDVSHYGFIGRNLIIKRVLELESMGLVVPEQFSKLRQKYRITEKGLNSIPSDAIHISRDETKTPGISLPITSNKIPKESSIQESIKPKAPNKEIIEKSTPETKGTGFNDLYERGMLIIDSMKDSDDLKQILDEMLMLHNEAYSKIEKIALFVKSVSEHK